MQQESNVSRGLPVVAVLPFILDATDPDAALVAQGMYLDICAELTRFRGLQVISPASAVVVADLPDAEVGQRLGASHVLRGRMQRAGAGLFLTASLSSAQSMAQLWTSRFEVDAGDPAALQGLVIARIASSLRVKLEEAAMAEARRRPPSGLAAYALTLRGLALIREGTREADDAARELFDSALAVDPHYPRAHAGVALSWLNEWSCQFWDRFEEAGSKAYAHARKALELDDSDAMIHIVIAKMALFHNAWEQAAWYLDRALMLCPFDSDFLIQAAVLEVYLGRPEVAVRHVDRAIEVNPYHPNWYFAIGAFARAFSGDLEGALTLRARCDAMPFVDAAAYTAVAYATVGQANEAAAEFERFMVEYRARIACDPEARPVAALQWLMEINPFRRPEDLAFLQRGFDLLGVGVPAPAPGPISETTAGFALADGLWTLDFAGSRAVLPDLKGLSDIRRLLEVPGRELHCLDLSERSGATPGGDAMLDEKARNSLKARIRDLQEDLAEAEDMNDIGRAEMRRAELDQMIDTLKAALGLGGRRRRLGDEAEKARTTVTWRIRHAMGRIRTAHPTLGRHLDNSLRTGTFCSYQPEWRITWRFAAPQDP
jgi:TolB-like protein